jgi:hypothetical protein
MAEMMGMVMEKALALPPRAIPRLKQTKPAKRHIRRNRASYSCQTCRRRKIKCDKEHPACGSCVRTQEPCVYGKLEQTAEDPSEGQNYAGTKRRWTPVSNGTPSPDPMRREPGGQISDITNLNALEQQLQRLGAMIETARQRSGGLPRYAGPLTPISGEDDWPALRNPQSKTLADSNQSLTKPLSELYISPHDPFRHGMEVPFWSSMADEVNQLHAMMQSIRPLDPPPDATAQFMPPADPRDPSLQQKPPASQRDQATALSFHSMAGHSGHAVGQPDCSLCKSLSVEKAMLLPGAHSTRLASAMKLNLAAGTPSETQSNVLFRVWLSSIYSAMPISPLRRVFSQYHEYWAWRHASASGQITDTPDVYFMPVLFCIWYTATLALSSSGLKKWFPDSTRAELAAGYHDQIIRFLSLVSFPTNIQFPLLGCLLILLTVPAAEEEPLESSVYNNLLVKIAQTAGLHREPSHFTKDAYEAEIRRRLWWQVAQRDVAFAAASGFPVVVTDDLADVRPITDVHERYFGTPEEKAFIERIAKEGYPSRLPEPLVASDSPASAFALVTRMSHKVAVTIRTALNMHTSAKVITKQVLQQTNKLISATHDEVMDALRRIPTKGFPELGYNPDGPGLGLWPILESESILGEPLSNAEFSCYHGMSTHPPMSSKLIQYHRQKICVFNKWARINLALSVDKMHCAAYAPFLKNAKSKVWTAGRHCALHHATSFMRRLISLATEPALESFRYLWPGSYNPMHAAIILLVDVHERPRALEAARSRALIDKIFSLSSPASGIVGGANGVSTQRPFHEGGTEAWDLLRDLRNWGWRKAGLDPNYLWTVDDQIEVGIAKPLTPNEEVLQSLREDAFEPESLDGTDSTGIASYPSMQYVIDATTKGLAAPDARNPSEDGPDPRWKHQPLRSLDMQQPMPFPLTGHEKATCASHAHQQQVERSDEKENVDVDVLRVEEMKKRAQGISQYRTNQAMVAVSKMSESGSPAALTNGYTNSEQNTFEQVISSPAQSQGGSEGSDATPAHSSGATDDSDMSEAFDWERWDQVFGQYSGFTDLMEMDDIDWGHDEKPASG